MRITAQTNTEEGPITITITIPINPQRRPIAAVFQQTELGAEYIREVQFDRPEENTISRWFEAAWREIKEQFHIEYGEIQLPHFPD